MPEFNDCEVQQEDRGNYVCRVLARNIRPHVRIPVYVLEPKSGGRKPAVLLLHDHGGRFDIGKEKYLRPIAGQPGMAASGEWAEKYFSGRFVGELLAEQGFVVLSFDALGWGHRSCRGFNADSQQALASK
ncbi:hypothetical protein [Spirochaeta dissipatitropha]